MSIRRMDIYNKKVLKEEEQTICITNICRETVIMLKNGNNYVKREENK